MSEKHDPQQQPNDEDPQAPTPEESPTNSWGRQIVGALIGAAVAFVFAGIALRLGWIGGDLFRYVLWGGILGGLVGASDSLAKAGAQLTHSDSAVLNTIVSLIGMAVVLGLIYGLAYVLTRLLRAVGILH